MEYRVEYVKLVSGAVPALDFIWTLDATAQGVIRGAVEELGKYGPALPKKMLGTLDKGLFELRVRMPNRIFRLPFFYHKGQVIVITSAFQKKSQKTPKGEITMAKKLKAAWLEVNG